jgi:hypothetical protein
MSYNEYSAHAAGYGESYYYAYRDDSLERTELLDQVFCKLEPHPP